jgi:hypothetical protein
MCSDKLNRLNPPEAVNLPTSQVIAIAAPSAGTATSKSRSSNSTFSTFMDQPFRASVIEQIVALIDARDERAKAKPAH